MEANKSIDGYGSHRADAVWAELHQEELKADWVLAMNGETPYKIAPLV